MIGTRLAFQRHADVWCCTCCVPFLMGSFAFALVSWKTLWEEAQPYLVDACREECPPVAVCLTPCLTLTTVDVFDVLPFAWGAALR